MEKPAAGDDLAIAIPWTVILFGSLKVSFVAVLETLISARIADNMTGTRFNASPECGGMALANIVSGILGGTPCTGVLVRTAVNCASGATHKTSQFINSLVVLSMVLVLMPVFSYIPMAAIAAILITSSCRLVPMRIISAYWTLDKPNLFIMLMTTGACVFYDGALGLAIGAMVCLLRNAVQTNEGQLEFLNEQFEDKIVNTAVSIAGPVTYITAYHIESTIIDKILEDNPENVVITLEDVTHLDLDGIDALKNIMKLRNKKKIALVEPAEPERDGFENDKDYNTQLFYYNYFVNSKSKIVPNEENLIFKSAVEAAQHL